MSDFSIPIVEPTIDYTKVPPINQKRTITFVNHFIAHTIIFLNKFSLSCETKLFELENKLQKVEAALEILEQRLSSIPELKQTLQTENKVIENEEKNEQTKPIEVTSEIDKSNFQVPTEVKTEISEETQPVSSDPQYAKYFKMIHFGVPKPAVKLSMEQEGLDSSILDNPHQLVQKPQTIKNLDVSTDS